MITDFGAIHDTLPALQAGTDMETGTTNIFDGALLADVTNGTAPEALVNQACMRILRTMFRLGVFNTSYTPSAIPVAAHDAVARQTEDQAITLLKNERQHAAAHLRDEVDHGRRRGRQHPGFAERRPVGQSD